MKKKELTAEEIYKKNQKKAKAFKILAPIAFWLFLALALVCLILAIKCSFGNIAEITDLLDSKKYTGEQLSQNYAYLLEKYGEWVIGTGGSGWTMTFVNIGNAMFNVTVVVNAIMFVIFVAAAFVIGKWFLPKLSKSLIENNQDMVNLTVLKNSQK